MDVKYQNALSEVYEILKNTDEELLSKIPKSIKKFIEENKNEQYNVNIDSKKSLYEQIILPETQAILSLIYRSYWATDEEKKEFAEKDAIELKQEKDKYDNDIFKNKKLNNKQNIENQMPNKITDLILVRKEKWYQKVWKKICGIFKK